MGFALAEEAARLGAKVTLVSGPTALSPINSQIKLIRVVSAKQMHTAVFNIITRLISQLLQQLLQTLLQQTLPNKKSRKIRVFLKLI